MEDQEPQAQVAENPAPEAITDIEDVMGPGNSKAISIKQDAKETGSRVSKKSKKIIVALVGGLAVAIMIGIMAAGNGSKQQEASKTTESTAAADVGRTPAPSPPQRFSILSNPFGSQTAASGVPSSNPAGGVDNAKQQQLLTAQHPAGSGSALAQGEPTPREKYKAWLLDHKYKQLEGTILASESATESGFGDQSMSHAQPAQPAASTAAPAPSGGFDQSTLDEIRAAEAKGLSTAKFDPAMVAAANAQKNPQDQNKSFLADNKKGDDGYLHALVENSVGQHELLAGSIIPAVLLTALDSDLPGFVTAMVRQTVYDSLDHQSVLIPQGAKLVGQYSSDVAYGQSRALIAWNRLIFPDGKMIDLQGMAGTDGQGQAGFADQVDNHYWKIFGSSILMSTLGAAAQLSQPQSGLQTMQPTPQQQAAAAMASGMANTGNQLLSKNLSVQPTIKIRAGYLFNVMVNKTMVMPAFSGDQG